MPEMDEIDDTPEYFPVVVQRSSPPVPRTLSALRPSWMSRNVSGTALVTAAGVTLAIEALRIVAKSRVKHEPRTHPVSPEHPVSFTWTRITIERRELS